MLSNFSREAIPNSRYWYCWWKENINLRSSGRSSTSSWASSFVWKWDIYGLPEKFFQIYTLHGLVQYRIIPCIYALVPDKSEDTYCRFLEEVRNTLDLEHLPQDIMTDFEIAAINVALLLLKEQKWKDASFICAQICGNEFREVDFNKDTSMILNLPIHFEWLGHWHLFHQMKPKLILNNTVITLETFKMTIAIQSLIIFRIPTLVGFVETHLEGAPLFAQAL